MKELKRQIKNIECSFNKGNQALVLKTEFDELIHLDSRKVEDILELEVCRFELLVDSYICFTIDNELNILSYSFEFNEPIIKIKANNRHFFNFLEIENYTHYELKGRYCDFYYSIMPKKLDPISMPAHFILGAFKQDWHKVDLSNLFPQIKLNYFWIRIDYGYGHIDNLEIKKVILRVSAKNYPLNNIEEWFEKRDFYSDADFSDSTNWIDRDDFGDGFDHDIDAWNHRNQ